MASMVVDFCAVVADTRREYGTSKRNVNVVLFGVVMSNVKCVIIEGKSTFAIKS